MSRLIRIAGLFLGAVVLLGLGGTYGASYYYNSQHGQGCASCHEMASFVGAAHGSMHRNATCLDCHEASMATKLRHIRVHLFGPVPESIHLRDVDVVQMVPNCEKCHQHEYASWHAGPHSATYTQIFADPVHNAKRRLTDDCLRCHGMHFSGAIRDLVQPQNPTGPAWHVLRADLADQPSMPCLTCHQVHRNGLPEARPASRISVAGAALSDSVAFFDRREEMHFAASAMALPQVWDGQHPLKVSPDPRQSLCYECHAPRQPETGSAAAISHWGPQAGSGDDRTPMGVHEGISCLACHAGHNENALASCKNCHPQMSHCGLDVEKMDTTFSSASSKHNIHWVRCTDCHQNGVPKMKTVDPGKRTPAAVVAANRHSTQTGPS